MFKIFEKSNKKKVKSKEKEQKEDEVNDLVDDSTTDHNDLKKLLKTNIKLNEEILEYSKKINNHLLFSRILSYIKIFLILVPIILGLFFLPKVVEPLIEQYHEILNIGDSLNLMNTDNFFKKFK